MRLESIITKFDSLSYNNWDHLINKLPWKGLKAVFKNTLPFTTLLPSPVGRSVHLGFASVNCVHTGWQLATDNSKQSISTAFELVKHSVDFGAGLFTSKWSSIGHTIVSLAENVPNLARKQHRIDAVCLVASDAFFLLSLPSGFSKKTSLQLTLISIGFQAFYRFYRTGQEIMLSDQDYKMTSVISNGLMGCIHLLRAYGCYCELHKIQHIVHQIFILMRHADKEKGDDPGLTEDGIVRSKAAASAIEGLRQELGKDKIQLVVSSLKRSQQTGAAIAQELGIPPENIVQESLLKERVHSSVPRQEKKNHPQYQHYHSLPKEEQFNCKELPDAESGFEIYRRMHEGITHNVSQNEKTLTVFVSHSIAIRKLFQGLYSNNKEISNGFLRGSKYCEISVVERTGNEDQGYRWIGHRRQRIELPSKPTSA